MVAIVESDDEPFLWPYNYRQFFLDTHKILSKSWRFLVPGAIFIAGQFLRAYPLTFFAFLKRNMVMVVAREQSVRQKEPGFYHCFSRAVRRAFLLGEDPCTKKNYEHRKGWIRDRLIHLARCFAIDGSGCAVMVNHTLCGAPHNTLIRFYGLAPK